MDCVWVGEKKKKRWWDVKSCTILLHDKQQPGASSDKALIQKIPPSFAENPNEDLKCSAGRRPRGREYTLPLLAFPAIVSLSPYWPSWDGDERDMTARRATPPPPTHPLAPAWLRGTPDSTGRKQTCGMTSRRRRKCRTNRSCLQKTRETKQQLNLLHSTGFQSNVKLIGNCKKLPRFLLDWRPLTN